MENLKELELDIDKIEVEIKEIDDNIFKLSPNFINTNNKLLYEALYEENKKMQRNFLKLKERFKHEPKKLEEIFTDWKDYITLIKKFRTGILIEARGGTPNFSELGLNPNRDSIKENEIKRRFKLLLKNDFEGPDPVGGINYE